LAFSAGPGTRDGTSYGDTRSLYLIDAFPEDSAKIEYEAAVEQAVAAGSHTGTFGGDGPQRLFDLSTGRDEIQRLLESNRDRSHALRAPLGEHQRQAMQLYGRFVFHREAGEITLS